MSATICFASVMALSIFVPLAAQLGHVSLQSPAAAGLADHFLFLHSAMWPVILISLIACIASGGILFERMRSPLVRFVRCFNSIADGSIPDPIVVRSADYLREEADALNRMISSLTEQAAVRREVAARFFEILGELETQGANPALLEELRRAQKLEPSPTENLSRALMSET